MIVCNETLQVSEIEDGEAFGFLLLPDLPGCAVRHFDLERDVLNLLGAVHLISILLVYADDSRKCMTAYIYSQSLMNPYNAKISGPWFNLEESDIPQCVILIGSDPYKESRFVEVLCKYMRDR